MKLLLMMLLAVLVSSCSIQRKIVSREMVSFETKQEKIRANIKPGDYIIVLINNVRYGNLKVLAVADEAMAVKPRSHPRNDETCIVI